MQFALSIPKATFGLPIAVAALVAVNSVGFAGFDLYASGTGGYDFSYPQCSRTAPAASFGVVGINRGYPFNDYNNCLAAEFAAAAKTGNVAAYINTGYDATYAKIDGRHVTPVCASSSQAVGGSLQQQAAWAVGCSEAERDIAHLSSQSVRPPSAWWLDVETSNSWSSSDLSLNRYAIDGIIARLRQGTSAPVGIYSTSNQWNAITGGFRAPVDADWIGTGQRTLTQAKPYCSAVGFTGARVWLVQYVSTFDRDYAC
ncbi:MAG TPA: hypothetical protein VLR46_02360 [Candidatus Dormibacteraeota bacterium]|nr:hypothetical protein [Candidatus Dormibacteraeota bacterium]